MHVEVAVKILTLLCDIMTHPQLAKHMKERYDEFYNLIRDP